MVQVKVDLTHLQDLGVGMQKVQKRGMEITALDLINKLMRNSPVDHGLLKQWFVSKRTKDSIEIRSPAFYTVYQNYGTPPIRPKKAKALRWYGKGGVVFAKKTKGIKGKKFVEKSIEQVKPRIENHFKVAIREVILS